ncbi:olfactory receptor class A-like protein 1 [Latimeria chalumnae]|uniref:olfactory receptor class A-like protein 1 n=1 Tax=Latimeria chalumnae TaxID=7897 RepID=UPI0003C1B2E7|nr:PREDICTED: vomeronasal type-1 receptor 1-like [Latimeria chalumnae]|eukprot:XP_005987760.1 PREDICTED: vomeronasal type-1 receptor 1-like [Latimeria chalumnae]
MDLCITIKGVSFLLQTGLGVLANLIVLLAYTHIAYSDHKLVAVDMILFHLAFVNMMSLLTRGIPLTMTIFGLRHILNDAGCVLVVFIYRVVRALSVCITCLLSWFQAITIVPATSKLSRFKIKVPNYIIPSFVVLWLINIFIYSGVPYYTTAPTKNSSVPKYTMSTGFCYVIFPNQMSFSLYGVVITSRDLIFVILMILASGYILLILYRHRQQVKALRNPEYSTKSTAESKAAKIVLTLVLFYIAVFGIENIIGLYVTSLSQVHEYIIDLRVFVSSSYASFSPLIILNFNKKIKSRLRCAFLE